jgi:hypothetical protein
MEKLVYLLFQDPGVPGSKIRQAVIDEAVPAMREAGASQVTLHVQDEDVAAGKPVRRSDPPIRAMVSFWLENSDDRGPCEAALGSIVPRIVGYLVAESRPLVHQTNPGGRTEGMTQVCCISRKPGLSDDEFYDIWTNDHKVVAIETQSTVGYVRNIFVRALTKDAPDCWAAIVEETFPIGALTDPKVFYDSKDDAQLKANLDRMMASVGRFLSNDDMEVTHTSEYVLG